MTILMDGSRSANQRLAAPEEIALALRFLSALSRYHIPPRASTSLKLLTAHGTSPRHHVRDFFDCVKSRAKPAANADVAARSHIACHAAYAAWILKRKVTFDPVKEKFVGDEEANRMRTRAMREPWRV